MMEQLAVLITKVPEDSETHRGLIAIQDEKTVTVVTETGWTPLMAASSEGYLEVVKFLIAQNINIAAQQHEGWSALMVAVEGGYEAIVRGWCSYRCAN
jgi:ankyrin repeat protein